MDASILNISFDHDDSFLEHQLSPKEIRKTENSEIETIKKNDNLNELLNISFSSDDSISFEKMAKCNEENQSKQCQGD